MSYSNELYLLEQLHKGDEHAFSYIFHQWYARMCVFALNFTEDRKEAEDMAKDAFLKIWESEKKFQSLEHIKRSIYQATKQVGINNQLSSTRRKIRQLKYSSSQDDLDDNHLDKMIYSEVMGELHAAIMQLPEQVRKVITLTYIDGFNNQEVADILCLKLQTVKNHKLRGLSILRKNLDKNMYTLFLLGVFISEKY